MSEAHLTSDPAHVHGGNLASAMARFGGGPADWLDLSTGINPVPPPLPTIPPEAFTRLPGTQAEAALDVAARRFYGAPDEAAIVAAPGSQILISTLPHLLPAGEAFVLEPTYGEHRRALETAGHRVSAVRSLEEVAEGARIVVAVNPNNPDGRILPRQALLDLHRSLAARGGLLVVDEAFADLDPAESLAPETGRPGLLVHRSFGKVFGYAGLRLGFALTAPDLGARLSARLGPWAVSGPALSIGSALMGDPQALENVRASVAVQAARRDAALQAAGLEIVGRTPLFALVAHPRANALFEALARVHILTRPFTARPDWLRIGNPADATEAARLEAAAFHAALGALAP